MADVAMGQKASYIPAEGDDINRATPVASDAVAKALEQAAISSTQDIAQAQTEQAETEKESPGTVELQWLEYFWLVSHGYFELVLESHTKKTLDIIVFLDNFG